VRLTGKPRRGGPQCRFTVPCEAFSGGRENDDSLGGGGEKRPRGSHAGTIRVHAVAEKPSLRRAERGQGGMSSLTKKNGGEGNDHAAGSPSAGKKEADREGNLIVPKGKATVLSAGSGG